MTERQAALIDARFYCGDNDADRQLMRLNGTICEWSVERQRRRCEADKWRWPKDSDPDDCSKYKRPFKYVWKSMKDWKIPDNVVQDPNEGKVPWDSTLTPGYIK